MLDIGTSRHFCVNKESLHDFEEDGECVYMDNSTTSIVMGKINILLKLTSSKTLSLKNVLYNFALHTNLIFEALLNKVGRRFIFEVDKISFFLRRLLERDILVDSSLY